MQGAYNFPADMLGNGGNCYNEVDALPGIMAGSRNSDMIKFRPNFI